MRDSMFTFNLKCIFFPPYISKNTEAVSQSLTSPVYIKNNSLKEPNSVKACVAVGAITPVDLRETAAPGE